ncbi:hypothetical protein Hanom_Chr05g00420081 [Helianthus anomalus]
MIDLFFFINYHCHKRGKTCHVNLLTLFNTTGSKFQSDPSPQFEKLQHKGRIVVVQKCIPNS